MHFVVIGKDRGAGEHRAKHRPAHLEFIAGKQSLIVYAGPLIEQERMLGSIFIFDLPSRAELDAYLREDPYFAENIFETIEIYESRRMVPEREPGFLLAEAEKARSAAAVTPR